MKTLEWLLSKSWKGMWTFVFIFFAIFVFSFFVPSPVKQYIKTLRLSFDFLPPPDKYSIKQTSAPTPGDKNDEDAPQEIDTYFRRLNISAGSVIIQGMMLTGEARGNFFSKNDKSFQIQLINENGTSVMNTLATTRGNPFYTGFIPWLAKVTYIPWKGACKLVFKKEIEDSTTIYQKSFYTEIPVICG